MINRTDAASTTDGFDDRELRLLEEIERSPHVTQRSLSRKLTIGLGMTNLLIRRLVTKGYVRATQAGWRSWAYSVTPQGMTRRVRLVRSYVRRVLGNYRSIRESLAHELGAAGMTPGARVAMGLYGCSGMRNVFSRLAALPLPVVEGYLRTRPSPACPATARRPRPAVPRGSEGSHRSRTIRGRGTGTSRHRFHAERGTCELPPPTRDTPHSGQRLS